MLRVVAFHLGVFVAPFALYALYLLATKRAVPGREAFVGRPLYWLITSGLALTIAAFFVVAALTGADPGGVYQPAEMRDGELVPGRIVTPDARPEPGD